MRALRGEVATHNLVVGAEEEEDTVVHSLVLLEVGLERQCLEHEGEYLDNGRVHENMSMSKPREAQAYMFKWYGIGRHQDQTGHSGTYIIFQSWLFCVEEGNQLSEDLLVIPA